MDQELTATKRSSTEPRYWSEMNCPVNPQLPTSDHPLLLTEAAPPPFVLPQGMILQWYHPRTVTGSPDSPVPPAVQGALIRFVTRCNRTETGNTTLLSPCSLERLNCSPCWIGVLSEGTTIVGCVVTVPIRLASEDGTVALLSTYTTFLCLHPDYRGKGLAMALVRGVMGESYRKYNISHGYYFTATPHHEVRATVESWYRPLAVDRVRRAGFTIPDPSRGRDRNPQRRARLTYHISRPSVNPTKATASDYHTVRRWLGQAPGLRFFPSQEEYVALLSLFDWYLHPQGLFLLFPLETLIAETGKVVHNGQLVLLRGDPSLMGAVVWQAQQCGYDLLYGWVMGEVTPTVVRDHRGHITNSATNLELYNSRQVPHPFLAPVF